jgi:hypothetical protein
VASSAVDQCTHPRVVFFFFRANSGAKVEGVLTEEEKGVLVAKEEEGRREEEEEEEVEGPMGRRTTERSTDHTTSRFTKLRRSFHVPVTSW